MNKQQFSPLKYILRKAAAPKSGTVVFFIRQKRIILPSVGLLKKFLEYRAILRTV